MGPRVEMRQARLSCEVACAAPASLPSAVCPRYRRRPGTAMMSHGPRLALLAQAPGTVICPVLPSGKCTHSDVAPMCQCTTVRPRASELPQC
jgi:hypothetical protein